MAIFNNILFGGDYNPEQWPKEIWLEDMRILNLANINCATINVFSWAKIQPSENVYDFSTLDEIINMLIRNNYKIVLATSTAALPAWMSNRYPEVNRTDFEGRKHKFGLRHNACPNSKVFQKYSARLAGKLAERYGSLESIICWHISNEYGGECYCENCEREFRVWLKEKYKTLENLNKAWNTSFWSHTFYSWDEIVLPNILGDALDKERTALAGLSIDYCRFNSESMLKNFINEKNAIRKYDKNTPVTTNLMGAYKSIDYFKFAKEMDIVSWDNYPSYDTPVSYTAMLHDLMRGLKDGKSFMLMEQTPNQQNWQPYNSLKRPGQMRSMSYQAIAHGADTVQFFQLRQSIGGCEKFHGAVIEHVGNENTRVFREVSELGKELKALGSTLIDGKTPAKIGIIFDWSNYWGLEYTSGPTIELKYVEQIHHYYKEMFKRNIDVDMISLEASFEKYDCILAPCLYMLNLEQADKIHEYVKQGGTFLTTMMSGIVDETDNVHLGGYPGPLKETLGIWVEEIDALPPDKKVELKFNGNEKNVSGRMLCDIIHAKSAEVIATYGQGQFYSGTPVITKNKVGNGQAYYVGTMLDECGMEQLFNMVIDELNVDEYRLPEGIETKIRCKDNKQYRFILNHKDKKIKVKFPFKGKDLLSQRDISQVCCLEPFDVMIIEQGDEINEIS